MSSTHALPIFSLAALSRRSSRLFSRWRASASTSSPRRSSKATFCISGVFCCSSHAAANAKRFNAFSFSMVGSSSTILLSVVVVAAADVLVDGGVARRRRRRLHRQAVEVVLQHRLDVPVRAGVHRVGAHAG